MTSSRPGAAFVRRPDLHAVEMDGELVMMGHEQGKYYGLRDVAATIWKALAEPRTLPELVALVSAEYTVDPETCRDDIDAFVQDLVEHKMVTST